ncbi:hypothetical protein [Natronobacterium texcoconense]|uniref:DUF8130 domain-containing protein n=1 Tax=Natronobacterium texcoconense TaxID=1095778 RepID=A0A1H1IR05_NATTX|nr:hypothetical protein [Natronobacterium texcoconense]SDR40030.1 hypothetical protein SAMN04489842_3732 [Natronobacterium texcoconense]
MHRRTVLATAGFAAVAGCIADPSNPSPGTDPTPSETDEIPSTFDATLSFPSYVLSMSEQLADEASSGQITDFADLEEPVAETLEEAIDDGPYETEEADDDVLEGLFGLQYVERGGTVYEISYSMPEYVVSSRDVSEDEVDSDRTISAMDDTLRVMGVDNRETIRAVNAVLEPFRGSTNEGGASDHDYRATILDDHLEEFLETYDYVVYPSDGDDEPEPEGYVELELDHEDPGPPYTVSVTEVTDEQRYGRPVVDVATYPDPAADALHAAAERRSLRTDERPEGIDVALEDDAYVRIGDGVYEPALESVDHDAVPVSLEITDVDSDDRAFTLEVSADDEPISLFSGAPEPFGVVGAYPVTEDGDASTDDGRAILWTDTYEEDGHVHVGERDGEPSIGVNDIGITTRLEPGDSMSEIYEIRDEWGFEGGHYRFEDALSVEWGGDLEGPSDDTESSSYPFVVSLAVPEFDS